MSIYYKVKLGSGFTLEAPTTLKGDLLNTMLSGSLPQKHLLHLKSFTQEVLSKNQRLEAMSKSSKSAEEKRSNS